MPVTCRTMYLLAPSPSRKKCLGYSAACARPLPDNATLKRRKAMPQSSVLSPPSSPRALIALRRLHKSFGRLVVLDDVSLEIPSGESIVIIGASGTGKSVLLKHIVGLLTPDSGEVWFDGQRIDTMPER